MELKDLKKDWKKIEEDNISKLQITLEFEDFVKAVHAINMIKVAAENLDHHPDLKIYDYNKLQIEIYTHDEKGLTEKDYKLASRIERVLQSIL